MPAHKLAPASYVEKTPKPKTIYKLPNVKGKFGVGLYIRGKEIFFGISVNDIIEEQVIRRRFVKIPKGKVSVYNYDSVS